ncbi:MAG: PKD domain-containing protein [Bacteroidota bacterium]
MKKSYFFLLFASLFFINVEAQNYELFVPNNEYHYTRTFGQNQILFSIKMDSSVVNGANTDFFNYNQAIFADYEYSNIASEGSNPLNDECLTRESWFSKFVTLNSTNDYLISNNNSDTILFKVNSQVGEEWVLHQNWNRKFKAQHINTIEQTVLNELDSIKEIRITVYDLSDNLIPTNIFNNKIILLSKNHGFVKTYSFFEFPSDSAQYNLVGNENFGIKPLKEEDFHTFEVNDYLVYENLNNLNEYIEVTEKDSTTNLYDYNFARLQNNSLNLNYNFQHNFQYNKYYLTGQFDHFNSENSNFVFINYIRNGKQYLKGVFIEDNNASCWPLINFSDTYKKEMIYSKNIGLVYRSETITTWITDEWGFEYEVDEFIDYKKLMSYRSEINADYGTYNGTAYSHLNINRNKTNSCDGIINYSITENNWIDSLRWDFGDGTFSNQQNVTHTYQNEGTYNPSVHLYSVFGDTIKTFYNNLLVGNVSNDNQIYVQQIFNTCNEKTFIDKTDSVESRLWVLPDGTTSTNDTITYTFDAIDTFQIVLQNNYAFCSKSDTINVHIKSLTTPIQANTPLTGNPQNSFSFFKMGNQYLPYFFDWGYLQGSVTNPAGDGFIHACNQFTFTEGDSINIEISLNSIEYYEVSPGAFDYNYIGVDHSLWIDYNNNASFETNEQLTLVVDEFASQGFYAVINSSSNVIISENSIKDTPLRMRLVAGQDPNITSGYDFSMIISAEETTTSLFEKSKNQKQFVVFPNPTDSKINVQIPEVLKNKVTFELRSIVGQRIIDKTRISENNLEIDLNLYSDGIYSLLIYENDILIENLKIIKD